MIVGGKELTAEARSHGQFIRSKQREGNVLTVPVNCFFGSTAYKDNFVPAGNIGRLDGNKPYDAGLLQQKFRAASAYDDHFNSQTHLDESSGQMLKDKTNEQRNRTKNIMLNQREGSLGKVKHAQFQGETAAREA